MAKPGPQKINRYGLAFKLRAVMLSEQPGVLIKDVAESLCIHPFMLESSNLCLHRGKPASSLSPEDVCTVRCDARRLLRMAAPPAQRALLPGRAAHRASAQRSPAKPRLLRQPHAWSDSCAAKGWSSASGA